MSAPTSYPEMDRLRFAVRRLDANGDFREVKNYIDWERGNSDKTLRVAEGSQLFRAQGAVVKLEKILEMLENPGIPDTPKARSREF